MFFPRKVNRALITWFGCGNVPLAPGTAGSVGALPICWILSMHVDLPFRIIIACGMTAIAILGAAQDQYENSTSRDPSYIVVDEVVGMLWSTILLPASIVPMVASFLLFRLFDVIKPFPANIIDQFSKTSTHPFRRGMHIVLDDVVAGIYAALVLQGLILYIYPRFMH